MKGKNNIRKFPTNHERSPWKACRKNKVQNVEGSADLEPVPVGKVQSKKIKYIWIWEGIIGCIWFVVLLAVSIYAGKENNFLSEFADALRDLWVGIVGSVVTVLCTAVVKKARFAHYAGIFFGANILFVLFLCSLKWRAIELDKPSAGTLSAGEMASSATPAPVDVSGAEVRYSMPYLRDEDIFVEELELYCGVEKGSIAEEEEAVKRADILEKDINASRKDREGKTKPPLFTANWEVADHEFRVFESQKKILEEEIRQDETLSENKYFINEARKQRIDELETAKNYRIEADSQYEDAENQKLLAQYCIGLFDEYLRDCEYNSSQESFDLALDNLQEGAEWAVKSIYNAVAEGDKDKMWKGMTELDNVIKRLKEVSDNISEDIISKVNISEDVIPKLKDVRDAYQVLIERQ